MLIRDLLHRLDSVSGDAQQAARQRHEALTRASAGKAAPNSASPRDLEREPTDGRALLDQSGAVGNPGGVDRQKPKSKRLIDPFVVERFERDAL